LPGYLPLEKPRSPFLPLRAGMMSQLIWTETCRQVLLFLDWFHAGSA
jgi:hypothetical protein